jgi:DNA-binding MarR family transcriptional regulator
MMVKQGEGSTEVSIPTLTGPLPCVSVHKMNTDAYDEISLKLLDEFTKAPTITQRALADRLDIALGLVNAYVKRLCKKGYIKVKNLPRNRIKYIITPKGFAEKAKLTYNYLHYSLTYFRDVRQKIEQAYTVMLGQGVQTVLLWGDGEISELCYISARGLPIKIIGAVGETGVENGFFGHPVFSPEETQNAEYDAILVASLDGKINDSLGAHVKEESVYYL